LTLQHQRLIKTKQRVEDHGEVLTSSDLVAKMLSLVNNESIRTESRYLEPACGEGNFLVEVFKCKIDSILSRSTHLNTVDTERSLVIAAGSLYGIDLLPDNVEICRTRLTAIVSESIDNHKHPLDCDALIRNIEYILECNIINGDALSLYYVSVPRSPIVFSEWTPINSHYVKRRDFTFRNLLQAESLNSLPLFSDTGHNVFIPEPCGDWAPVHYLKIYEL